MSTRRSASTSAIGSPALAPHPELALHGMIVRDERTWKPFYSSSDPGAASSILHVNSEDLSSGSLGFLYDYYGITEETQHGPPSPGASNEESKGVSTGSSNASEKSLSFSMEQLLEDNRESSGEEISVIQEVNSNSSTTAEYSSTTMPASVTSAIMTSSSVTTSEGIEVVTNTPIKAERSSPNIESCSMVHPLDERVLALLPHPSPKDTMKIRTEEKYINILEAPTSIMQKQGEDTLTYLNKGQFYAITCEAYLPSDKRDRLKSIIYLVFRDEKDPRNELDHWHYWSSQQPNPNQRAFDVDRKACQHLEEIADDVGHNAFGFTWNPIDKAKVVLRINCLSTDFSPQKGVKGIPLHLQVDTYENTNDPEAEPVYRAFCQIKVFRDKGAERKNKDESKSAERRLVKIMKGNSSPGLPSISNIFQSPSKLTRFTSASPKGPKPWVFTPHHKQQKRSSSSNDDSSSSRANTSQSSSSPSSPPFFAQLRAQETKRQLAVAVNVTKNRNFIDMYLNFRDLSKEKLSPDEFTKEITFKEDFEDLSVLPKQPKCRVKRKTPAVTIYVRKEEEKVYNALMLENLTMTDLKDAVANKYGMPSDMIKNLYKKTRKGILVNMDDMMVEQFVDEDDFIIQVNFDNHQGHFELTFLY